MTHITPSNTQVQIPIYARIPNEVGDWIPNQSDNVVQGVYNVLVAHNGDRTSIFRNPVANSINTTIAVFQSLVVDIQTYTTEPDLSNMVFFINTSNATITFLNGSPANTSNVIVEYPSNSIDSITDLFVANGAQTVFVLSQPPDSLPEVYVNSVHQQPNVAFSYIPQYNGIISKLQDSLMPHTNRLSGVTKATTDVSEIDLEQILAYGTALNTLDEENIANNVMYSLASLFCGDVLQGYSDIVIGEMRPAIRSNTENSTIIGQQLNDIRDGIDNMIQSDLDYHAQIRAKHDLSTLANFMKSVYSEPSGRWLIEKMIGTEELNITLSPDKLTNNDPT